ncbi:MAG: ABC transporter permease subunit [Pyrinomonadaceae bacterium]|nr:ABC transporter permease subunit [Pyrinomonadaceae bacterium]
MVTQVEKNNQSASRQNIFSETFRFCGEPARFMRANLFVIWIVILFLFWMFTPIQGIPYPSEVLAAFQRMFASEANDTSNLVYNTWTTLKLNIVGLFFASVVSLLIAYFSVLPILQPLNQILQWFRYLPIVAFNLVFLSIFTIGWSMKVAMLSTGMAFFLITSMTAEIAQIPKLKYELARVLNYGDFKVFWTVVLRPTLPAMIDIVAQSAAMGWVMIVAIETFNRTEGGIGAAIYSYSSTNQKAEVYVYLIIIGIIAILEDQFFYWLKRILFPYTTISERA